MLREVNVWGQVVEVEVVQKSKTVWIAVGYYMEQRIEVKRSSLGAALAGWKDAATYKGN